MVNQKKKNNNSGSPVEKGARGGQARFFEVASFSQKEKTYLVRQLPGGEWVCSCPHFLFNERKLARQGKSSACDHILKTRHLRMKRHGRSVK